MSPATQPEVADDASSSTGGAVADQVETNTGLDENVAAALSYVLGWLTGIVMFLVESDNNRVRFHAAQSIVVFGSLFVLSIGVSVIQGILSASMSLTGTGGSIAFGLLSTLIGVVSLGVWIGTLVLWIYLIVRTYQGQDPRIPVAAGIADGFA